MIFVIVYTLCTIFITFTKEERHYYVGIAFELLHIKKKKQPQIEAQPEAPQVEQKVENNEENKKED